MRKFIAFTLAETLIVMGIIGVVAALTLPNLNSTTGEKEKVAKVKKIYSNLADAFGRAEAVYGPFNEWFINDGNNSDNARKRAFERLTEFMKVSKSNSTNTTATFADGTEITYEDKQGFWKVATLEEIREKDYNLTPASYVGLVPNIQDDEPYEEKMPRIMKINSPLSFSRFKHMLIFTASAISKKSDGINTAPGLALLIRSRTCSR